MRFYSVKFWDNVLCKLIESLISIKVWILICTFVFGWWLASAIIAAQAWIALSCVTTIMSSIIAPIVIMREGFKISKIHENKEKNRLIIEHNSQNMNMNIGQPQNMNNFNMPNIEDERDDFI